MIDCWMLSTIYDQIVGGGKAIMEVSKGMRRVKGSLGEVVV